MVFEVGGVYFNRVIDWCHSHYPDYQGDMPPPSGTKPVKLSATNEKTEKDDSSGKNVDTKKVSNVDPCNRPRNEGKNYYISIPFKSIANSDMS